MNKSRIISELNLQPFGNKGYMRSDECECPECSKSDKFGILFLKDGGLVSCMRCGFSTSLFNYLLKINRKDLIEGYSAPIKDSLKELDSNEEEGEKTTKECKLPYGFEPIFFDDYLDNRGWSGKDYKKFGVGISKEHKLRNHLVFPIYQNGKLSSWLARSRKDKDWHKQNIKDFKAGTASLVLRYYNSEGTEFSEVLGGLDDITEETETVILVEGLFDKQNTDHNIKGNKTVCCYTFGKSLSTDQLKLIQQKGKKVKNLVLMYDPDALKEIEKYSLQYMNKFSVLCARLTDKDPGDLNQQEFNEITNNLRNPLHFSLTNLKKIE